jgi:hypothetical protein
MLLLRFPKSPRRLQRSTLKAAEAAIFWTGVVAGEMDSGACARVAVEATKTISTKARFIN